jgi:hypothetical protein
MVHGGAKPEHRGKLPRVECANERDFIERSPIVS